MSDFLDVRGDGPVEPPVVPQPAHHVLLAHRQLVRTLLPQLLGSPGPGSAIVMDNNTVITNEMCL